MRLNYDNCLKLPFTITVGEYYLTVAICGNGMYLEMVQSVYLDCHLIRLILLFLLAFSGCFKELGLESNKEMPIFVRHAVWSRSTLSIIETLSH